MRNRDDERSSGKKNRMNSVDSESLAGMSKNAVDKLVRRVNSRGSAAKKKQRNLKQRECSTVSGGLEESGIRDVDTRVTWNDLDDRNVVGETSSKISSDNNAPADIDEEIDDVDWEDGSALVLDPTSNLPGDGIRNLTIEIGESPDSVKRKPARRVTAEDKELAELVHKVHLLCLLARGRIIDAACDDPLIQASLLSLLPSHLLKISGVSKLYASILSPLVSWFHDNFHVRKSVDEKRAFHSGLAAALEAREGTPEEIVALSVALFRALKLTTRFVAILDVASIKPEPDKCESSERDSIQVQRGIFNTSTLMIDRTNGAFAVALKSSLGNTEENVSESSNSCRSVNSNSENKKNKLKDSPSAAELKDQLRDSNSCSENKISDTSNANESSAPKRKGDIEFEMQLQMALSATAVAAPQSNMSSEVKNLNISSSNVVSPLKRIRRAPNEESAQQISTALGSRKLGAPLYWAEVYCSGENLAGKWVHIDVVNAIVDGEQSVEAASSACKKSLRYVVAFAGHGAKDVTRRYCTRWYKVAPQRVDSRWWDAVLAPLRDLESGATGGTVHLDSHCSDKSVECENEKASTSSINLMQSDHAQIANLAGPSGSFEVLHESGSNSFCATRNSLEDMELETRALTEPLPTNQQAYKNHQLYAIERWLTKFQILHPRGPVLGFCSGHPVYPRTCVQILKTKERWLREGLQVKASEVPAKVLKQSKKLKQAQFSEDDDYCVADPKGSIELYGRWQLEPLSLPRATNGIVPKNERNQVEVWSEKCLPPGTVHLRLPRVFYVAKKLEIDYAPAMVGFEFRNGRSFPTYDGIVVCSEFKDVILEAYAEEEGRRAAEERKRNEAQALSRWYQLLSSIITRQRLNNRYGHSSFSEPQIATQNTNNDLIMRIVGETNTHLIEKQQEDALNLKPDALSAAPWEHHEHIFLAEDQSFDEESSTRTKRCRCGFSVQVEEL